MQPGFLEENAIYCGDARDLLRDVRPESVALSFWSPSYFVDEARDIFVNETDFAADRYAQPSVRMHKWYDCRSHAALESVGPPRSGLIR